MRARAPYPKHDSPFFPHSGPPTSDSVRCFFQALMRPYSRRPWTPAGARDLESPSSASLHTPAASHCHVTPPGASRPARFNTSAPATPPVRHAPGGPAPLSFRKLRRPERSLSAREWVGTALTLKQMTPKVDVSCAAQDPRTGEFKILPDFLPDTFNAAGTSEQGFSGTACATSGRRIYQPSVAHINNSANPVEHDCMPGPVIGARR